MSNIQVKANLTNNQISFVIPNINPNELFWNITHFHISFPNDTSQFTEFNYLSFSLTVKKINSDTTETIVLEKQYPQWGMNYINYDTTQQFLESETINLIPETEYKIEFSYTNAKQTFNNSTNFTTPSIPGFEKQFLVYHPDLNSLPPEEVERLIDSARNPEISPNTQP